MAYATLVDSETLTTCWRPVTERLGVADFAELAVLANRAEWIWHGMAWQFPGAWEVLDPFHTLEHVAVAAKSLYAE